MMTYSLEGTCPYVGDLLTVHLEATLWGLRGLAGHLKGDRHKDLVLPRTLVAVATTSVLVVASAEAAVSVSSSVVVARRCEEARVVVSEL